MEDLLVHNFSIKSHVGDYLVEFDNDLLSNHKKLSSLGTHYIIDLNVVPLLGEKFFSDIAEKGVVLITANEQTKSYQGIEPIIESLIEKKLKRDSHLVAIGGGITQDITCFIATTFMRGIGWTFVPTTLLAQADSCIGSKSSINFGKAKNILGSFNPPNQVIISEPFLGTLKEEDIKSGIGEIIKLYIVDGKLVDSDTIRLNLSKHLYNTLQIKKRFIEEDEFDVGPRNLLNYGHCLGHAIEASTNFGIPHGIAITMGMDIANRLAKEQNLITDQMYSDMSTVLFTNYYTHKDIPISKAGVFSALTKDKKNTGSKINIILPVNGALTKHGFENNSTFWEMLENVLFQMPLKIQS